MVESSKILTVSYGTFSCTLEGFDDSFSTMKAIAEYFRDLAAGDRYFGAEPPTPDAEMLSAIAQRETSRPVEAQKTEDGFHLRAAAPALAVVEPAMPPEPQRPAAAPDMSDLADMGQDDAVEDAEAALAEAAIEDAAPEVRVAEDVAEEIEDDTPEAPVMDAADDVTEDAEAFFAAAEDAPEEDVEEETYEAAELSEAPAHPDPSSVAAKLQRIRAVVGQTDALEAETYAEDIAEIDVSEIADVAVEDIEDEIQEDVAIDDAQDIAEAMEETAAEETAVDIPAFEDVFAQDDDSMTDADDDIDAEESADVDLDDMSFEDDADEMLSDDSEDLAAFLGDDSDIDTPDDAAEAVAEAPADDTDAQISAVLRNLERAGAAIPDDVEITSIDDADAEEDDADAEEAADLASDVEDTLEDDAEAVEEVAAKPTLRARILRVAKRVTPVDAAEPEAAQPDADVASDIAAEADTSDDLMADVMADIAMAEEEGATEMAVDHVDEAVEAADDNAEDFASDLSQDDEDDLQRALQEATEVTTAEEEAPRPGRSALPENDDAAMSRIMEQADEELSNPESSRRRAAIAQLKAAVAATEAARQLGENGADDAKPEDAFREDLDKVVRPRRAARPEATESRSERPRPAPLKLVASQRVDPAPAAPSAPVQPRRVAMSTPVAETDADSFAEFAEEMGAKELPDLLEAAAAYTAYVEGSDDFSRPQIMKKVQATTDQSFSREDGLRSFGTLLREGRINKAGNGRFQVSDQTRFKPEQKAG